MLIKALGTIEVVTLFGEDLIAAREFYTAVFAWECVYEDDVSSVLKFDSIMVNLLQTGNADELVKPAPVGVAGSGSRFIFTVNVPDTDAVCRELTKRNVPLLNGPIDRVWGRRTAAFADPAGHVWEVAQNLDDV